MVKYRGYYIDHVIFDSKKEIDDFLEKKAVWSYKNSLSLFLLHPDFEHARYSDEKARELIDHHGYSWEQIDKLEEEWIRE